MERQQITKERFVKNGRGGRQKMQVGIILQCNGHRMLLNQIEIQTQFQKEEETQCEKTPKRQRCK